MRDPSPSSSIRPLGRLRPLLLLLVVALLVVFTGCPLEFEDLDEPTIEAITVAPSSISQSDIGVHGEFDLIEISTANFDDDLDPDSVEVFISDEPTRSADRHGPGNVDIEVQGNVVTMTGVQTSWFSDHNQPGDYNVGAYVEAANTNTSARVSNLEIVTVTD